MADLLDSERFTSHYEELVEEKEIIARALDIHERMDFDEIRARYENFAERLRPMVCDTSMLLNQAMRSGKRVLFEGAQGTMLDIDHGTYPFVTSSSATAGGACTGTGVAPTRIQAVIGISKAYATRVGSGPFPTEARDGLGDEIRRIGNEFGSVTGRPRRCGWFDIPLIRYTATVNAFDSIAMTKLDVLDSLERIPVCVAYKVGGRELTGMPASTREIEQLEPCYEYLPGWQRPTGVVTRYDDLPQRARDYLRFLEKQTCVEIGCISVGPERNQTVMAPDSRFSTVLA
jgi:adenylosuccinate synthase